MTEISILNIRNPSAGDDPLVAGEPENEAGGEEERPVPWHRRRGGRSAALGRRGAFEGSGIHSTTCMLKTVPTSTLCDFRNMH